MGGNTRSQIGARQGAQCGCHLQKHSDANIGEAFPDIRDSRARRSGDDRNQRSANGIAKIDMEEKSQRGHDDHAPAQTSQRTEQPGENRHQQHRARKFDQAHPLMQTFVET